jgi:hypothetical protein
MGGLTLASHRRLNSMILGVKMILGTPFQPCTTSGSFYESARSLHLVPKSMFDNIRTYLDQPKPIGIDDNTQLIHLFSELKSDPSTGLHVVVPSQPRANYKDMLVVSVDSSRVSFLVRSWTVSQ